MELLNAIYGRRAVRNYTTRPVDAAVVEDLLRAAVQAPSAINHQPWAFVVIQDRSLLRNISSRAKESMLHKLDDLPEMAGDAFAEGLLKDPDFNMFYNAGTLILVCAKPGSLNNAEDCCLAAQNLMLAAHAAGLGTCPIGFSRPWLNEPAAKAELGIPMDHEVVLPLILGYPAAPTAATPRNKPEILSLDEGIRSRRTPHPYKWP